MTTEKYNGWTNYETWAVNLWLGNDESSYRWASDSAKDIWDQSAADDILSKSEQARYTLSEYLKDQFDNEDACELLAEASMYTDLLRAALSEVRWYEIADAWLKCDDILEEGYEPIAD